MNSSNTIALAGRRGLWWSWTLSCALGELIGMSIAAGCAAALSLLMGEPNALAERLTVLLVMVFAGCMEGVAIGFFQWRVLRRVFARIPMRDWLIPTVAVAAIGWLAGMLQPTFFSGNSTESSMGPEEPSVWMVLLFAAGFGVVAGAVFGVAQWLVLRSHAKRAWLWIPTNAIGWALGLSAIYLGATIPAETWPVGQVVFAGTLTGMAAGLSIGAITGLALLQIIPQLDVLSSGRESR